MLLCIALAAAVNVSGATLPNEVKDLVLWLNAEAINAKDGDKVANWADASEKKNNAVQTNDEQAPMFRAKAIGGKPSVIFAAARKENLVCKSKIVLPYTLIAVARIGETKHRVISSASNNWLLGWITGTERYAYTEGGWSLGTPVPATMEPQIFAMTGDGATTALYHAGKLCAKGDGGIAPGCLALGGYVFENVQYSDCEVSEVIAYARVLTDTELNGITEYLTGKYFKK